ncbi:MAG: SurA N-terminal domain-containing protein [Candidatus Omnitrophota bacterium]
MNTIKIHTVRFLRMLLLLLLFYYPLSLPGGQAGAIRYPLLYAEDKIVAIVNKDVITQKDLDDFINFMRLQLGTQYQGKELETKIQSMKLDLLDKLIDDRLITQKAEKENIRISPDRVKGRINEIRRSYGSDSEFQSSLAKQGMVQADLEQKIGEQLLMYAVIDRKVKSKIAVNPAEVTDFYRENANEFILPEHCNFESLTVNDKTLADEVFARLKNGEGMQEVAERYSLSVNKLSCAKNGELRKDIEDIVFSMSPGEMSPPVKIQDSYYIIKLIDLMPPLQQSLTEVQDRIYAMLFNVKIEESLAKLMDELKENSYIKIMQD